MLANCFRSDSDLRDSIPKSTLTLVCEFEVPDGSGGLLVASVRKVEATEN